MIRHFCLVTMLFGFLLLAYVPLAMAQEAGESTNEPFIDRDGDGVCDGVEHGADSPKKSLKRHRLRHRRQRNPVDRGFGYGFGRR